MGRDVKYMILSEMESTVKHKWTEPNNKITGEIFDSHIWLFKKKLGKSSLLERLEYTFDFIELYSIMLKK